MIADQDQPEELSPEEIVTEIRAAGIGLTKLDMQAMIEAHKATIERNEAADRETERRHRPHALLAFTPDFMNKDTPRKAAERGELKVQRVGGRLYCTIADFEEWLIRTDKFKGNKHRQQHWHAMIKQRFP